MFVTNFVLPDTRKILSPTHTMSFSSTLFVTDFVCRRLCHFVTDFVTMSLTLSPTLSLTLFPTYMNTPRTCAVKSTQDYFSFFLQVPLRGLRSGVQRGAARQLIHPLLLLDIQILGRQWKQLYLPPDTCLRLILIPRKWRNFKGKKENLNKFWTHVVIHITCQ